MYRLLVIYIIFALSFNASGQVCFKGKIETRVKGKLIPINFASVVITHSRDTLKVIASSISDAKGEFVINKIKVGKYRIFISMLGYKDLNKNIRIRFPSMGNVIEKHFLLQESSVSLNEVSVQGLATKREIDKTTYHITKSDIKIAYSGVDLVSKVPKLSFDDVNQKVVALDGGTVKILINGVNASAQELMALEPVNVKSIEYYDFPPARYIGASKLINVKTKHANDGFFASVNIQHAVTTCFGNDGLYMQYNWGNNKISFNGNTYLRNYSDVDYTNTYKYSLSNIKYERLENQDRKFGYDDNHLNLTYSRNVKDKYDFQIKVSPNFQNTHIDGDLDILNKVDSKNLKRSGLYKSRTSQFNPSLDIYTKIYLPKKQELVVNILGTYYDANQKESRNEFNDLKSKVLEQNLNLDNRKKSIISQINYNKKFGLTNLSIGNYNYYGFLESKVQNNKIDYNYDTKVNTNYSYCELSGLVSNFMYRLSLGVNYYYNSNNKERYNSWIFKPKLILGYKFHNNSILRLAYAKSINQPSLGQISENKILIADNIFKEGNPNLKNSVSDNMALLYTYDKPKFSLGFAIGYKYLKNCINSYFTHDKINYISLKYENAKYQDELGFGYNLVLKPFKNNLFTAKIVGEYSYIRTNSNIIGKYTHESYPLNYELAFNKGKFHFSYKGNICSKDLSGPYISRSEKVSNIKLRYSHNNLSISLMSIFFLVDTEYKTNTTSNSIVNYSSLNNINDNRTMFTIGLSYRFKLGKEYKNSKRSINNSDTDAGMFN